MSHVPRNISFYLLMQDEKAKKAIEDNNEKAFREVLFEWGIDTDDSYTVESYEHRPLENNPLVFNGPLVQGSERLDDGWLNSGYATWEARVEGIRDGSLRAELKEMGRQGCADRAFVDEKVGKRYAEKEQKSF